MSSSAERFAKEQFIDREKLERLLPRGVSHKVTDEIIELISNMGESTGLLQEYMEESFLSHLPVLKDVKVDLRKYVDAIKYCNLKRSMSNEKAWIIVFPEKYERLRKAGKWNNSHVAMYNQTKIVMKIDAQMAIAEHIQYAPLFHEAIMRDAQLMRGTDANGEPVSAHVQHLAASTLIEKLAPPKDQKIDLRIGLNEEAKSMQEAMIDEVRNVAEMQKKMLEQGHSLEEVQKLNLKFTDADVVEDDDDEI